jgi:O-antigen/teichoic acid export membrane protein
MHVLKRKFGYDFSQVFRLSPHDTSTQAGRSRERYRLIGLAGTTSIVAKGFASLLGVISVSLAIGYLGKQQFGLWMVVNSLVVWMQLADFGVSNGLVNALAEAYGKNDKQAACAYVATSLFFLTIISLITVAPFILSYIYLPWGKVLNISDPECTRLAASCFLILGLLFLLNTPFSIVHKIYSAFQLGYVVNGAQIVSSIVSFLGLVAAIRFRLTLPWLVMVVSSAPLLTNILLWALLGKYLRWMHFDRHTVSRKALNRIAESSIPLFLYQIGALLVNQAVNIVLAHVAGLTMVADYQILLRIYMLIFFFGTAIAIPFYPALREASERKDDLWVLTSIRKVLVLRTLLSLLLSLPLLAFGDWLIYAWIHQSLNETFGLLGWLSLMILLISSSVSSTLSEILLILDDIRAQIKMVFLAAIITLAGIFYFVPQLGLIAVYMAMSVSTLYPIFWSYKRLNRRLKIIT